MRIFIVLFIVAFQAVCDGAPSPVPVNVTADVALDEEPLEKRAREYPVAFFIFVNKINIILMYHNLFIVLFLNFT